MIKKIIAAVLFLTLIGVGTGIYMWNKPHAKVEDSKGIETTATALAKEYSANEQQADTRYLNKAIEVTGAIQETETNQDGGVMVILKTDDAAGGIQCAMRDKEVKFAAGQTITIKGFCSGNGITGVSLTDCILKQ